MAKNGEDDMPGVMVTRPAETWSLGQERGRTLKIARKHAE
jgi:hypothetical protein